MSQQEETIQHESEMFTNQVRAHLTTTKSKPCTYFATDLDGNRVFVKGPYASMDLAYLQFHTTTFKQTIDPNLPLADMKCVALEFSKDFLNCQFGCRKTITGNRGFFVISNDLFFDKLDSEYPTKMRSSPKAWPIPVPVVDLAKLPETVSHFWYDKSYEKTPYALKPTASVDYVLHVLTSWVCGCGADLANSNFLIIDDRCYQIDLEAWNNFTWNLSDTVTASFRTNANAHMCKFIYANWDVLEERLSAMIDRWNAEPSDDWGQYKTMKDRLDLLKTLDGVIGVVQAEQAALRKRVKC